MKVACDRSRGSLTAIVGPEDRDQDAVAAALDPQRMKRLVQVADEVNEKFQRDRAI